MPVIVKLSSGSWRAQVRRKGRYINSTFRRKQDADEWALGSERNIDRGLNPNAASPKVIQTYEDIIALHISECSRRASQSAGRRPLFSRHCGFHLDQAPSMISGRSSSSNTVRSVQNKVPDGVTKCVFL